MSYTLDTKVLDQIRRDLVSNTANAVLTAASECGEDMKASFGVSVSPPGGPPGVDTGTLFDSIEAKLTGPAEAGIFGASYGVDYLEDGTIKMEARPFIRPAVNRILDQLPDYFKVIFE